MDKRGNFLCESFPYGIFNAYPFKKPLWAILMGRCPKPCELLKKFDQNFYLPAAQRIGCE